MKRPIKFRIWSNEKSHYVITPEGMKECPNGTYVSASRIELNGQGELYDIYGKDDELVYEQFVGMHDRDGTEIWEGDVVTLWLATYPFGSGRFEVDFQHGCFGLRTIKHDGVSQVCIFGGWKSLESFGSSVLQVLGNVHEHPCLLKA